MRASIAAILSILFIFSAAGFAHGAAEVEEIIVTTDITTVDTSVAEAAAEQSGDPVLIAENGELSAETEAAIDESGAETVVLVGGPAVIKTEVEARLKAKGKKVVRLWGFERTATAIEVAKHFWPEGTMCAVLVEDTKDPEADTGLQKAASRVAANRGCEVIPIPDASVPSGVLAHLKEQGVTEIRIFLRRATAAVREALRDIDSTPEEVVGEDAAEDEAEEAAEDAAEADKKKLKLVIVAAPNHKHTGSAAAHRGRGAVVKILDSADSAIIDELAALVSEKGITDIKVVGFPALAQEIADALSAKGLTVTKISGEKASEVGREVLKRVKAEWEERHEERAAHEARADIKAKIKARVEANLVEAEEALNEGELEIEELATEEGVDSNAINELRQRLTDARARLTKAKARIAESNIDEAEIEINAEAEFRREKHDRRAKIKLETRIKESVEAEEGNVEMRFQNFKVRLERLRGLFAEARARCQDREFLASLVEKVKGLHASMEEAIAAKDRAKAVEIIEEMEGFVRHVKPAIAECGERGRIRAHIKEIVEEREQKLEEEFKTDVEISEKLREAEETAAAEEAAKAEETPEAEATPETTTTPEATATPAEEGPRA